MAMSGEIFSREQERVLKQLQVQQKFMEFNAIAEFMAYPSFRIILEGQFDIGFESYKILGKEKYPDLDWSNFNSQEARSRFPSTL